MKKQNSGMPSFLSMDKRRISKKVIVIIFIISVIIRLSLFFIIKPYIVERKEKLFVGSDSVCYDLLAKSIVNKGDFILEESIELSMIRTPGYPVFIAAIYKIFNSSIWLVIIFQILLDSLAAIILMKLTFLFFGQKIAFGAGLLYAIDPFLVFFSNAFLSESLFVFLILLTMYYFVRFNLFEYKYIYLFFSSIFLSLATLTKPIALYLIFPLVLLTYFWGKRSIKARLKSAATYSIVFLCIISSWIIRNKVVHGHYFFSTSFAYNSLILYAVPIISETDNISQEEASRRENKTLSEKYSHLKKEDYYKFVLKYKERANEIIKKYPGLFIKTYFMGILDMFYSVERGLFCKIFDVNYKKFDYINSLSQYGIIYTIKHLFSQKDTASLFYSLIIVAFLTIEYIMSLVGVYILINKRKYKELIILMIPIIYFILLTGSAGLGRLKLPIIPFYLVLVSIALYGIFYRKKFVH